MTVIVAGDGGKSGNMGLSGADNVTVDGGAELEEMLNNYYRRIEKNKTI